MQNVQATTNNPKLDAIVSGLADDLRGTVNKIEQSTATTQNHYGDYMRLISGLSKGNKSVARIIALALVSAGANRQGVSSAVKLCS